MYTFEGVPYITLWFTAILVSAPCSASQVQRFDTKHLVRVCCDFACSHFSALFAPLL